MLEKLLTRVSSSLEQIISSAGTRDFYKTIVVEIVGLTRSEGGGIYLLEEGTLMLGYSSQSNYFSKKISKFHPYYTAFGDSHHHELLKKDHKLYIWPLYVGNKDKVGLLVMIRKRNYPFRFQELFATYCQIIAVIIKKFEFKERVARLLVQKNHFISLTAHEMRTPLTSIFGYLQLLCICSDETILPKHKNWLNVALIESHKLNNIVNELLLFNRITDLRLVFTWERVSLGRLLKEIKEKLLFLYPNENLKFLVDLNFPENKKVIVDVDKIETAIVNMIDKILKKSDADTETTILTSGTGEHLEVIIKQDKKIVGIGRGAKSLAEINNDWDLSIYIATKILNAHGGKLRVDNSKAFKMRIIFPKVKFH